jgi:hypothetical protein
MQMKPGNSPLLDLRDLDRFIETRKENSCD